MLARPLTLLLAAALAQPPAAPPARPSIKPPPKTAQPAPPDAANHPIKPEDLPPAVRLGLRMQAVARQLPTLGTLVLVPDTRSYAAAIAAWSVRGHFPVLIDDGSWTARENIARFTRAFAPPTVLRWSAPADFTWPTDAAARGPAIREEVAHAWGAKDAADLAATWAKYQFEPPGVVAINPADPAWTAGLALAAGRGELVAIVDAPIDAGGQMTMDQAAKLAEQIDAACAASPYAYARLGDPIDAVTLCLNTPGRTLIDARGTPTVNGPFYPKPNEPVATTDLIGRALSHGKITEPPFTGARWAWAGQIIGSETDAAYRAMCALFIQPPSAFLFNGYEHGPGWGSFDSTAAAKILEAGGYPSELHDAPHQGIVDWRDAVAGSFVSHVLSKPPAGEHIGGLGAGWLLINTSGYPHEFHLRPGDGLSGDVPLLARPAIVHFVHSFSAQNPAAVETVAGRFLEHGAYAYVGSVHEPFLSAFVPTPLYVQRSLWQMPLGAAARLDNSQVWRIAVLGDPLITIFPAPPIAHAATAPALAGGLDVDADMRAAAGAKDYLKTITDLRLLARDEIAARLAGALLRDHPDAVTPALAREAVMPAFRFADLDTFVTLAALVAKNTPPAQLARIPDFRDAVWAALWPSRGSWTPAQLALLTAATRPEQIARDAGEIADAIATRQGAIAGRDYLRGVLVNVADAAQRRELEAAIEKVK